MISCDHKRCDEHHDANFTRWLVKRELGITIPQRPRPKHSDWRIERPQTMVEQMYVRQSNKNINHNQHGGNNRLQLLYFFITKLDCEVCTTSWCPEWTTAWSSTNVHNVQIEACHHLIPLPTKMHDQIQAESTWAGMYREPLCSAYWMRCFQENGGKAMSHQGSGTWRFTLALLFGVRLRKQNTPARPQVISQWYHFHLKSWFATCQVISQWYHFQVTSDNTCGADVISLWCHFFTWK